MNVFPARSLAALIAPITEDFCSPDTRVREKVYESAVATGFDRGLSVLTNAVDSSPRLFVDKLGELTAVVGGPGLLVAAFVTAIVRDWFGGVAPLGDVLGEVSLTNGPATERRDVRVVGAYCTWGPSLTGEVTGVLAKMTRAQFSERRRAVLVAGEEVDEPIKPSTRVLTVVAALATWPLPCLSGNPR